MKKGSSRKANADNKMKWTYLTAISLLTLFISLILIFVFHIFIFILFLFFPFFSLFRRKNGKGKIK